MKPEDASLARKLVDDAKTATLSTLTRDDPAAQYPFASLVATVADEHGRPVLLLSKLAEHTKNLTACPRASLLYADHLAPDPLASPRVTLLGRVHRVPDDEITPARDRYLAQHPSASTWATFADFAFYRLEIEDIRLVVGFGKMGWIDPGEYSKR
jgi:putative heme iron utilization protein